jgi:hypothetical protein
MASRWKSQRPIVLKWQGHTMNKRIWGGIIMWGLFVTGFGLEAMHSPANLGNSFARATTAQEVIFLLSGGIVTCLVGLVGLIGVIKRNPGFNKQPGAAVR